MDNDKLNENGEYDPSKDEEFYKNLTKAFSENDEEDEDINLDINTDEEFQWIDIDAAAGKEESGEQAGPADSEDFEEELFANAMKEAMNALEETADGGEKAENRDTEIYLEPADEDGAETAYGESASAKEFYPEDKTAYAGNPDRDEEQIRREEDDMLASINASLASQISLELKEEPKEPSEKNNKKNKKLRKILIPVVSVLLVLCCCFALLLGTSGGRRLLVTLASEYAYSRINKDPGGPVETGEMIDDIEEETEDAGPTPTDIPEEEIDLDAYDGTARHEENVINILLLGEEAIGSGTGRGRTDLMMIATMNLEDGTIKLTSLMRDMLVAIPGYQDNKLNAAYGAGGVPLLYDTIELNFDIHMDGYILVNFESFEHIIDSLGGVEITLTREESAYLNRTNYISNPAYRTTVPGTQILNGNQALGYCRVRYVPTGENERDDYGRTSRHRTVLNAIFDEYKSKSLLELALIMNDILPMLTTDLSKEDFTTYLNEFVSIHTLEMEEFRLPVEGAYEGGRVRGMSVLIPDLQKNVEALHEFIFGNYEG